MTYYKTCELCRGSGESEPGVRCDCMGWDSDYPGLVLVAEGAIVIEDGFDNAVERIVATAQRKAFPTPWPISREDAEVYLRAAAGEKPSAATDRNGSGLSDTTDRGGRP